MELENNIYTAHGLTDVYAGKQSKFQNLLVGAAILLMINFLVALFFYASPNVVTRTVRVDNSTPYTVAKTSAFEERVKESRSRRRPVEKVRPVLQAAAPVVDALGSDPTVIQEYGSRAAATSSESTNAVYNTHMGARPVASHAASFAASVTPRSSDLQ